jgi:uncharacterized membrane protein
MRGFSTQRYKEIDFLRALAILLMISFHLVYDLNEFMGVNIDYQSPFWSVVGGTSALLFMVLSGVSCGLSRSPLRRGIKVLIYGMGVTVVTYLFLKEEYVRFGILHFLGVAMIMSPLFLKLPSRLLGILAAMFLVLGIWFRTLAVNTSLLLPLGLMYEGFNTIDYYPLFPYLAATLIGILAYRRFYDRRTIGNFALDSIHGKWDWRVPAWMQWLSRNSLEVYLIHQPIFLLVIFLINHFRS